MSTWNSKPLLVALGLLLLTGCDDAPALLKAQDSPQQMTLVDLAGGDVLLSAPRGYCIDPSSVRRSTNAGFALLARCDALGVKGFFAAQELALITVTTAPQDTGATAPTLDDLIASASPSKIIESKHADGLPLIRLATEQSVTDGLSPEHWRSAFALNGQLVGLALYAPETSPALGSDGARILAELANLTRRASATARPTQPAKTAETPETGKPAEANKSPFKVITGLFE
ncbi:hypothetical protein [Falsiphaeobacter marinintestinus]|uniref:hypothetical protein n=1 Tax=Falsiphaeobacter marinintestinus TaxID=1492905 RepID=UPI0011B806A7|nr:hypothetical protein [Phaeobacter marinintestinus]